MTDLNDNRLVKTFAEMKAEGKKTVIPFITAGYPNLAATQAMLSDFEGRGVRICEVGVPFSDSIADGPTIQASYTDVLREGMTSEKAFEMVRRYREGGGEMALVAMVSYSIVYRHGVEEFLAAAADAGFDGTLVPDVSLEEAPALESLASSRGLANVMLIAPNTPPERRIEIARHSRGFIYFISVTGITGERDELPDETIAAVAEFRTRTDTPVCVGFGISNAEMVRTVCEVADAAIVGSAIIHRITDARDTPADQLVRGVGDFVGELLAPVL